MGDSPMDDDAPAPLSRRRFLVAGVAGTAARAVGAGVGVWSTRSADRPVTGFAALVGDRTSAVAGLGRLAVDSSAASGDPEVVLAALPAGAGLVGGASGSLDVTDPAGFAGSLSEVVAAELAAGELVVVGGFPLTPTEATLAAACWLAVG